MIVYAESGIVCRTRTGKIFHAAYIFSQQIGGYNRTGNDCYSAMYLIHWFHSSLSLSHQIRIDWKNELKDFKKISKKQKRISKKK